MASPTPSPFNTLKPNLFGAPKDPTFTGLNPASSSNLSNQKPLSAGSLSFDPKSLSDAFLTTPFKPSTPKVKVHDDNTSYSIQTPNKPPKLEFGNSQINNDLLKESTGLSTEFLKMYLMVEEEIANVSSKKEK